MSSRLFQFSGEKLGAIEWCEPHGGDTVVADSWFVHDGHSVAFDRHRARFTHSATTDFGIDQSLITTFLDAVAQAIPREGSWFPRIELHTSRGGLTLHYREREAPVRETTVSLAVGSNDPRTVPHRKGPDLDQLMSLRRSVSSLGATEAVIVSNTGHIIEGAYSTLVWWKKDAEHLSVVDKSLPRIPSVTESVVIDLAEEQGIDVVPELQTLSDLEGAEVWVLSALHGIRLTTDIVGGPTVSSEGVRHAQWQKAWWAKRAPL
jgi:branched-subunit amino acid aminotransferase/4-amino-4-deoxychorismate lyase